MGGLALSQRDGGDRLGDGGRPVRAGCPEPRKSLGLAAGLGRGRLRAGNLRAGTGANQAAAEAWARVVPGSAFSHRAILARLRLFHDTGRLADAEQLIIDAAEDPRNDRTDLLVLLVPIYSQIGRSETPSDSSRPGGNT